MNRFNIIDHFLLSGVLYEKVVKQVEVLHEIDNTSDHYPLLVQLHLQESFLSSVNKIYTPRVSWAKASQEDVHNYRTALSNMLHNICVPTDTLLSRY